MLLSAYSDCNFQEPVVASTVLFCYLRIFLFVGGLAFRREKRPYNEMLWALVGNLFPNEKFWYWNWFYFFIYALMLPWIQSIHCIFGDLWFKFIQSRSSFWTRKSFMYTKNHRLIGHVSIRIHCLKTLYFNFFFSTIIACRLVFFKNIHTNQAFTIDMGIMA